MTLRARSPRPVIAPEGGGMPDVVLPVLNEAEAIPWVIERMPEGYRPIIVDLSLIHI